MKRDDAPVELLDDYPTDAELQQANDEFFDLLEDIADTMGPEAVRRRVLFGPRGLS